VEGTASTSSALPDGPHHCHSLGGVENRWKKIQRAPDLKKTPVL